MTQVYRRVSPDFALRTQAAKKVLLIDIGGLGDVVHALPAMWAIRQAYPQAELHCVVRGPWVSLLKQAPWIDRLWPYLGKSKSLIADDWRMAAAIRAQGYDVAINLMGSNRSCIISRVSGARWRLGRKPMEAHRRGWRWFNTEVMEYPYLEEPMYLQKWKCVQSAGFTTAGPVFKLVDNAAADSPVPESSERPPYLHVSPYTSGTHRELPPEQMAQLLCRLRETFPGHRLVLSCSADPRERTALAGLLDALPFAPWKVFCGTLDAAQLLSLIRGAALHFSGDTGSMHLAWLAGTPSISWFYRHAQLGQWAPRGARHALVFSEHPPPDYLREVATEAIVQQAQQLLEASGDAETAAPRAKPAAAAGAIAGTTKA